MIKRRVCIALCALAPALAAALLPAGAGAALNAYFEADGLQGESTSEQFRNQIEVLSFSWGVSRDEGKKPSFSSFALQKLVDRTSPRLLELAASGAVVPRAKLHVVRAGGDRGGQEFLRYCFAGVRVTSLATSGATGGDEVAESLSFTYEYIVERYARQRADGTLDTPVFGGWDVVKNLVLPPGDC